MATRTKTTRFNDGFAGVVEEMFYNVFGRNAAGAYTELITRRGGSANGVFEERPGCYAVQLAQWDKAWTDYVVYWDRNDANAPFIGEIDVWADTTRVNGKAAQPASGGGAFAVTVTVTNAVGGAPIVGANVRMTDASGSYEAATIASGVAGFNLDASTYTLGIFKAGFLYAATSQTVSGAANIPAAMTQIAITAPADPDQTTAYTVTRDGKGTIKTGVTLYFQLVDSAGAVANAFDRSNVTAVSDGAGLLQVALMKNRRYRARHEKQKVWTDIPSTGSAGTFALPEILSDFGS